MGDNLPERPDGYDDVLGSIVTLLETTRRATARAVNAAMTATYWELGRRLVEYEQGGESRAAYGAAVLEGLAEDLSTRFGRGFSVRNLRSMRQFYVFWPDGGGAIGTIDLSGGYEIRQTLSAESGKPRLFALPWSHYVALMAVKDPNARSFYERESLAGGWSIRQLKRQIGSQFFERAALSKDKAKMLKKGEVAKPGDLVTPEEELKDPLVLEFLDLKDEYSESDLEEALIHHLEEFLLELGGDFTFVGRQKRLRVGERWFRVDLVLYHRRLRCLVIIDLKLDDFSHADVGQMNVYLNYAAKHWTHDDENPPVGLILCATKDQALAEYALAGLEQKMLTAEYRTKLPTAEVLAEELRRERERFEAEHERRALPDGEGS